MTDAELCARGCGRVATHTATRGTAQLPLCQWHTHQHAVALTYDGWDINETPVPAGAHQ